MSTLGATCGTTFVGQNGSSSSRGSQTARKPAERIFRCLLLQTSQTMAEMFNDDATRLDIGKTLVRADIYAASKRPSRVGIATFGERATVLARRYFANSFNGHLVVDGLSCGSGIGTADLVVGLDSAIGILDGLETDVRASVHVVTDGCVGFDDSALHDVADELASMQATVTFILVGGTGSPALSGAVTIIREHTSCGLKTLDDMTWAVDGFRSVTERLLGDRLDEAAPYLRRSFAALTHRLGARGEPELGGPAPSGLIVPELAVA